MKTLLEQVKDNSALQVTSTIESILKQKTLEAIEETRKQVAADSFGIDFESTTDKEVNEAIDAAYEGLTQLDEWPKADQTVDKPMATELKDKALYNHDQYHQGNHDAHHGGWAMHDLHTWAKNYARKADKGVYDKTKAVKGLTHAIRNSEASTFGKAHGEKHGQRISGATRTHAASLLLPHVEKLMDQHRKKKPVTETTTVSKREDPYDVAHTLGLPTKKKPFGKELTAASLWKGLGGKRKAGKKPVTAKDLMTKEEEVTEAKEPRKNSIMHSRLVDHGFQYKGAKGKFHHYQNAEGHEIKHQYPTWLGNHSFKHTDPSGKVVWKSPQTGDTEIAHHLDQHFPKKKVSEDYNSDLAKRKADDQASFNRHVATHAASLNTQDREKQKRSGVLIPGVKIGEAEKKSGKKPDPKKVAVWKNDERMPWPKNYTTTATRSPIHDFAEEEIEEDLTYPQITQDESHKKNPFHDELTKHGYKYKDTYHYKGSRKKSNPSFKTHTYEHPSFHDAQVVSFNNGKNHHATVRGQTAHEPKDLKKVLFGGLMKEDEIAEKRDPFGFGKRDLARLGTIDKTIKNQVKVMGHTVTPGTKKHAILMQQKAQADDLQRNEAEQQHHAISKPAAHKPMSPEQIKAAKKAAWQNDERMPWPKDYLCRSTHLRFIVSRRMPQRKRK